MFEINIYIYISVGQHSDIKMPIGKFGEIIGTTRTLEGLGEAANYDTKVIAPRNPKLIRGAKEKFQVFF